MYENNIPKQPRLNFLDVFRGFTLFFMLLVNSNIDENVFYFFSESEWNGITPADFIFPTFLFIMGVAIYLSKSELGKNKFKILLKILKRSFILFLLGLFFELEKVNFIHLEKFRYMGVLQRLGISYFIISTIHLYLLFNYGIIFQCLIMFLFFFLYIYI